MGLLVQFVPILNYHLALDGSKHVGGDIPFVRSFILFFSVRKVKSVIITPLPSQIHATKGLPKLLQCGMQKDPDITVKWIWTKDGSPVDAARTMVQADGTLRINTVYENDAGWYTCRVESVAGNAATSGTLSVQGITLH